MKTCFLAAKILAFETSEPEQHISDGNSGPASNLTLQANISLQNSFFDKI